MREKDFDQSDRHTNQECPRTMRRAKQPIFEYLGPFDDRKAVHSVLNMGSSLRICQAFGLGRTMHWPASCVGAAGEAQKVLAGLCA